MQSANMHNNPLNGSGAVSLESTERPSKYAMRRDAFHRYATEQNPAHATRCRPGLCACTVAQFRAAIAAAWVEVPR